MINFGDFYFVKYHVMKINTLKYLFFAAFAVVTAASCAGPKIEPPVEEPDPVPTISLSKTEIVVPAEGRSGSISISILEYEGWTPSVACTGCVTDASLAPDLSELEYVVPENTNTVVLNGTVTVMLSQIGKEDIAASVSFVQDAAEEHGGGGSGEGGEGENVWKLVTDASTLAAGDHLVIACNTKGVVAGEISESVFTKYDTEFSEDKSVMTSLPNGSTILILGGSADSWTLSREDGKKLGATTVKKLAWDEGVTTWKIGIKQNNATIQSTTASYGTVQYNASSPRFTTYTSGQQPVQLYRNGNSGSGSGGDTPVKDPYVTTQATVSGITSSSATVSATFYSGVSAPSKVSFAYGTDASYFYGETPAAEQSETSGSFNAEITGLKPSTKYYFKALMTVGGKDYEGDVRSFTTAAESGSGSDYTTKGWFELPSINDSDKNGVDDDNANIYYAYHSFTYGGQSRRNYTVCYSGTHHCPVWVAAPRHSFYSQKGTSRSDAYKQDPDIPSSIQYSSKDTGGGCNKGHMLGSAERLVSADCNRQVFYYPNIAPQLSAGFNTGGGGWNLLEDYMDGMVPADTLYEVVGCYFEQYTDGYGNTVNPKTISFGGRSDVSFPTMFYYAVLRTKSGTTRKAVKDCSASELQCVAFVRSHTNDLKGQKPSSRELMSIADLEKITGYTYFVNVPNAPKTTFSASDWGL